MTGVAVTVSQGVSVAVSRVKTGVDRCLRVGRFVTVVMILFMIKTV